VTQVLWGLGGTLVAFAFAVLRWSFGRAVLDKLTEGVGIPGHPPLRQPHDPLRAVLGHDRGMATVAGSVLVGYALLGVPLDYLLAATFMTAPSGLLMAAGAAGPGTGELVRTIRWTASRRWRPGRRGTARSTSSTPPPAGPRRGCGSRRPSALC
jgi:hypothetical protein